MSVRIVTLMLVLHYLMMKGKFFELTVHLYMASLIKCACTSSWHEMVEFNFLIAGCVRRYYWWHFGSCDVHRISCFGRSNDCTTNLCSNR